MVSATGRGVEQDACSKYYCIACNLDLSREGEKPPLYTKIPQTAKPEQGLQI